MSPARRASRAGLLHYYFGTKEQLLVEAVRRDCELRMELLEARLAAAQSADDFIGLMAENLRETVREDPDFITLLFELFTLARRSPEIATEYAALMRSTREHVAQMLRRPTARGSSGCMPSRRRSRTSSSRWRDGFALRMLASPSATSPRRCRRHRLRARAVQRLKHRTVQSPPHGLL